MFGENVVLPACARKQNANRMLAAR
jgi:hypothetical protein